MNAFLDRKLCFWSKWYGRLFLRVNYTNVRYLPAVLIAHPRPHVNEPQLKNEKWLDWIELNLFNNDNVMQDILAVLVEEW